MAKGNKQPKKAVKKAKAHTENDERYTNANRINNEERYCPRDQLITATQNGNEVTVRCWCGISHMTVCVGCINWIDALSDFMDKHAETPIS
jgi:hypothetical protein